MVGINSRFAVVTSLECVVLLVSLSIGLYMVI